jgi:hypothetical protein
MRIMQKGYADGGTKPEENRTKTGSESASRQISYEEISEKPVGLKPVSIGCR